MSVPYRCTHRGCRRRVTLPRRRERYLRAPRCPECRRELTGRPDMAMRAAAKRNKCGCSGYHFWHRKGSGCWCDHAKRKPTDADWRARGYQIQGDEKIDYSIDKRRLDRLAEVAA